MFFLFFVLFIFVNIYHIESAGDVKLAWGYEGDTAPSNWGKMFKMCAGDTQSGRDIVTERAIRDVNECRELKLTDWTMMSTKHSAFRVKYSGSSISFSPVLFQKPQNKWVFQNKRDNAIARLNNQFGRYNTVHKKFCFHSFHFHWGAINEGGSEHNINGVRYPLEVHFVHYSCDYPDIQSAISDKNPRDKYVLGVVGILFKLGNKLNRGFEDILTAKRTILTNNKSSDFVIKNLLLKDLLPNKNHLDFWGYDGSLTTPPCNPIVRWHVLKNVVTISPEQLERFKNLFGNKKINIIKNFRPVQKNRNDVFDCSKSTVQNFNDKTAEAKPDTDPIAIANKVSSGTFISIKISCFLFLLINLFL